LEWVKPSPFGGNRHVVGTQARDYRHGHGTNHDNMHSQLKSWGTCRRVAFVLESWHWVFVMACNEPEANKKETPIKIKKSSKLITK